STHHPSRNVILIVGDALRSDHMSVYGYGRSTTPNLARMLQMPGAVKVPMVHSVCAETTCGVLALLASKFVFQIAPHSFSLIEVLRRNNYKTHLILSGDHTNFYDLRKAYGQGDDYYDGNDAQAFGYYGNDDALVVDRVAKLAPWDGGNHYFQFHLMSAHSLGSRHEEFLRYQPASDYRSWVRPSRAAKTVPSEVIAANNFYDNGVLQFDAYVARILASLSEKG